MTERGSGRCSLAQGREPAGVTLDVAMTAVRAAVVFFIRAWLVAMAIRFGRLLRGNRSGLSGTFSSV